MDSSVSAALLKEKGFNVTGVFIKVWSPPFLECSWKEDRLDAMRVCAKIGIPFKTLDLEKEYKREVVDYMIREYRAGRTPNPDVMCNRAIKFGAFFDWAEKNGADFVATGHYARNAELCGTNADRRGKFFKLLTGKDKNKDQSYFLWTLTQRELARILFPVGGMKKMEVRKLAKKFGLPNAEKKDSQGLCFLGKVNVKEFLGRFLPKQKGKVLNEKGEAIGEHDGAHFFTIGERHCFRIKPQINAEKNQKPYYVIAKDIKKNTLIVAHRPMFQEVGEIRKEVFLKSVNWIYPSLLLRNSLQKNRGLKARIRYRAPLLPCKVVFGKNKTEAKVIFESPMEASFGQSLVIYEGDNLVGGGIISS